MGTGKIVSVGSDSPEFVRGPVAGSAARRVGDCPRSCRGRVAGSARVDLPMSVRRPMPSAHELDDRSQQSVKATTSPPRTPARRSVSGTSSVRAAAVGTLLDGMCREREDADHARGGAGGVEGPGRRCRGAAQALVPVEAQLPLRRPMVFSGPQLSGPRPSQGQRAQGLKRHATAGSPASAAMVAVGSCSRRRRGGDRRHRRRHEQQDHRLSSLERSGRRQACTPGPRDAGVCTCGSDDHDERTGPAGHYPAVFPRPPGSRSGASWWRLPGW